MAAHKRPNEQNLFGIVQGGLDPVLRWILVLAMILRLFLIIGCCSNLFVYLIPILLFSEIYVSEAWWNGIYQGMYGLLLDRIATIKLMSFPSIIFSLYLLVERNYLFDVCLNDLHSLLINLEESCHISKRYVFGSEIFIAPAAITLELWCLRLWSLLLRGEKNVVSRSLLSA